MPLVLSENLVLSESASLVEGTPWILWDNVVTFANISSDSEETGFPATNLANPATNQEWRAASSGTVEVTVSLSVADDIEAVGIARHNFGSEGVSVEVGYYDGNFPPAWVSLAGPIIPVDDTALLFVFDSLVTSNVVVKMVSSNVPRAAVLYVGPLLRMERGVDINVDFPIHRFSHKTEFYSGRSHRGDYLGRIVTSKFIDNVEHTFKHITPDWYRSDLDPFLQAAQQDTPFFYCFAPEDYPHEVAFAWLMDDPIGLTSPITRRVGVVLRMGGIVE